MAPESLARNTRQAAASSTNCASVVSPAMFRTRQPLWRIWPASRRHNACSLGEPNKTTPAWSEAASRVAASTKRSGSHCLARLFSAPGLMPMTGRGKSRIGIVPGRCGGLLGAVEQNGRGGRQLGRIPERRNSSSSRSFRGADFAGTRRRDGGGEQKSAPSRRYPMRCGMPARRATSAASKELGAGWRRRSGAGAERGPDPAGRRRSAARRCTRRRKAPEHKGRRPRDAPKWPGAP